MSIVEIKVPDIGGHENVDIIAVEVKAGDTIAVDDTLITLETDKATMDVPADAAGVVKEVKVKVGDKVSEGGVILLVETAAAADAPAAPVAPVAPAAPATLEPTAETTVETTGPLAVDSEAPVESVPVESFTMPAPIEDTPAAEAPVAKTQTEPASDEKPKPSSSKKQRVSVPAWDDIIFGSRK